MRARGDEQGLSWYAINLEELVPADHPLREVKGRADRALRSMPKDLDRAVRNNSSRWPG